MCAQVQADNKVEVVLPQRHIQMYGVTHTVYFFPKAFSFCHPYQIYICSCGRKILFKVTCNAFKLYMLLEHVFLGNWNSDLGIAEGSMLYRLSYSSTYQLSANLHKANGVGMDIYALWPLKLQVTFPTSITSVLIYAWLQISG